MDCSGCCWQERRAVVEAMGDESHGKRALRELMGYLHQEHREGRGVSKEIGVDWCHHG